MSTPAELEIIFKSNADQVAKVTEAVARAMKDVTSESKDAGAAGDAAGGKIAKGMRDAEGGARSLDGMLKTLVGGLAAVAAVKIGADLFRGAVGVVGEAVNLAANFESTLSEISALTGATGAEMKGVHDLALQLGADTAFSAQQAAGGISELLKAGVALPDVLQGGADAMLDLAAAGGVDVAKGAEIASVALNVFKLSGKEMTGVVDKIAGAANATSMSVEDFGYAMQQSAAVANLAGFGFEDLATAITVMGKAGMKGSDAGTSLKTFMSNLIPTTKKQIEMFAELGIITNEATGQMVQGTKKASAVSGELSMAMAGMSKAEKDAYLVAQFGSKARDESTGKMRGAAELAKIAVKDNMAIAQTSSQGYRQVNTLIDQQTGKFKDMGAIAGILKDKLKGLTDSEKMVALEAMFGSDAIRAASMMAEAGAEGFAELSAEMGKVTASEVAAERLDNLKGALEAMKGSLETAGIKIGEVLLPGLQKIVEAVTPVINSLGDDLAAALAKVDWDKITDDIVRLVEDGIEALKDVDWAAIAADMKPLVDGFLALVKAGAGVAGVIHEVRAGKPSTAPRLAARSGPGGAATGGLEGADVGQLAPPPPKEGEWVTFFRKIRTEGGKLNKWNDGFVRDMTAKNKEWEANQRKWGEKHGEMVDALKGDIAKIAPKNAEMVADLKRGWGDLKSGVSNSATELGRNVTGAWNSLKTNVTGIVEGLVGWVTEKWTELRTNVETAVNELKTNVSTKWNELSTNVQGFVSGLVSGVVGKWAELQASVSAIVGAVVTWVTSKWQELRANVEGAVNALKTAVIEKWNEIVTRVTGFVTDLKEKVSRAWEDIRARVLDAVSKIRDAAVEKWEDIRAKLEGAMTKVRETIIAKWNEIRAHIETAIGNIRKTVTDKWEEIKTTVASKLEALRSEVEAKWNAIRTAIENKIAEIKQAVRDKWDEIKVAIAAKWDEIKTEVAKKIGELRDKANDKLDELKGLGADIVAGIRQGISDKWASFIQYLKDKLGEIPIIGAWILQAHSPSKVFTELGEGIMQGLANGLKNADQKALGEMQAVLNAVLDIVDNALSIIERVAAFKIPADAANFARVFDEALDIAYNIAKVTERYAQLSRNSTNQVRGLPLLDREELRNIAELIPVLSGVTGFVSSLADALSKLAELKTPNTAVLDAINDEVIGKLVGIAESIVGRMTGGVFAWATFVPPMTDALRGVADLLAAVSGLDLSKVPDLTRLDALAAAVEQIVAVVDRISLAFRGETDATRKALVEGIQAYAAMASAAVGLLAGAAGDVEKFANVGTVNMNGIERARAVVALIMLSMKQLAADFIAAAGTPEGAKQNSALSEAIRAYADMARGAVDLFGPAAESIERFANLGTVNMNGIERARAVVGLIVMQVKQLAADFIEAWGTPEGAAGKTAMSEAVRSYVDMARAAVDLLAQAGGLTVEWAKATVLDQTIIDGVLVPNVRAMVAAVQSLAAEFMALPEALGQGQTGETRGTLASGIRSYVDMARSAVDLMSAAGGVTVEWAKATLLPAGILTNVLIPNVQAMVGAVAALATVFMQLPDALKEGGKGESRGSFAAGIRSYVDMARSAVDLFAAAGGITVDWAKATALPTDVLQGILIPNVRAMVGAVAALATAFMTLPDALPEGQAGETRGSFAAGIRAYTDMAKGAIDLLLAAGGITVDWSKVTAITADMLVQTKANILVLVEEARKLKADLESRGLTAEDAAKLGEYLNAAMAPIKALADSVASMNELRQTQGITASLVGVAKRNVEIVIAALMGPDGILATIDAAAFEARAKLVTLGGTAAESLAKVGEFIANFIDNPFSGLRRSARTGRISIATLTAGRQQTMIDNLKNGIRAIVRALVEALTETDALTGLTAGDWLSKLDDKLVEKLKLLADAYGAVADAMTRMNGVTVPQNLDAIIAAAQRLAWGISTPPGGGAKTTGFAPGDGEGGGGATGTVVVNLTNTVQLGAQTLETIFSQLIGEWSRSQTYDQVGA